MGRVKLLLDTHVFVWAATGDRRLPPDAATLIVDPTNTRTLSAASVWEMSIKAASGRWAEVAPMLGDLDEVGGVRAVVTADDEQQVHWVAQHLEERVLPLLGGAADGVEYLEGRIVTITLDDGGLDPALDLLGLALEHGRLVGDADFSQMDVGVEAGFVGAFETF